MPWSSDTPAPRSHRLALAGALGSAVLAAGVLAALGAGLAPPGRLAALSALAALMVSAAFVLRYRGHRDAGDLAQQLTRERDLLLDSALVGALRRQGDALTWHNGALGRLLGHDADGLRGRPLAHLFADAAAWGAVSRTEHDASQAGRAFRMQAAMRRRDGTEVWVDLSGTPLGGDEALWMVVDIDAAKRADDLARATALRDGLTGLPNRRLFEEKLGDALAHARRSGQKVALCFLDLEGFKTLNGLLGRAAGEQMLREVSLRLPGCVRGNDVVARLADDTFALVLHQVRDRDDAMPVVQRCLDELARPVRLPSSEPLTVKGRIGVVLSDGFTDCDTLVRLADQAVRDAKAAGATRVHVHAGPALPPAAHQPENGSPR